MKYLKYFIQFLLIIFLLIIFKIVGLKFSRIISSKIFLIFGPLFRSKEVIRNNISFAFPNSDEEFKKTLVCEMWKSYGKIFAEYIFIKNFRKKESNEYLEIKGIGKM